MARCASVLLLLLSLAAAGAFGQTGWILRGNVLIEGAGPPAEPVAIERACAGLSRRETITDSAGRFAFHIKDEFRDPTTLLSCQVRAVLPGYSSSVASLGGFSDFYGSDRNIRLGTIFLRPLAKSAATTVTLNALRAPAKSRQAYERGLKAFRKSDWRAARRHLETAVHTFPQHEEAWCLLGLVYERERAPELARDAYRRSIEANRGYLTAYVRAAELGAREKRWADVADVASRGIRADAARYPVLYVLRAFADFNLGDLNAAENGARAALKLDAQRQFPKAEHILGTILLQKGDVPGGIEHLRAYLDLAPGAPDAGAVGKQIEAALSAPLR